VEVALVAEDGDKADMVIYVTTKDKAYLNMENHDEF
jgi:methylglyoxal synthase